MTVSALGCRVLLLGAGSVGAVYVYQLQRAACTVTAVCRSNYDVVKAHGFRLTSVRFGNVTYRPERLIRSVSECANETFDYVVVCTKAFPRSKPSLSDLIRPIITDRPNTAIVIAQNGIAIEDEVSEAFPQNPIISAVIYCPATQTAPGVIDYPEMLSLVELGTFPANAPQEHKAAASLFAELMIRGGGGAEHHENIQIARWSKLLMNAPWNPICALTLCTDGGFLTTSKPYAQELIWEIMLEVVKLAQTIGIPGVNEKVAAEKFAISKRRSEIGGGREMSMLQDVRQGRKFEVEAIAGNAVRLGRQYAVPMPRLETVYALLKARYAAMFHSER